MLFTDKQHYNAVRALIFVQAIKLSMIMDVNQCKWNLKFQFKKLSFRFYTNDWHASCIILPTFHSQNLRCLGLAAWMVCRSGVQRPRWCVMTGWIFKNGSVSYTMLVKRAIWISGLEKKVEFSLWDSAGFLTGRQLPGKHAKEMRWTPARILNWGREDHFLLQMK